MFEVNPETAAITMHQGDTGAVMYTATRSSGEPFGENDVALYTVVDPFGAIAFSRTYSLSDDTVGNGKFLVQFHNADTDHRTPGTYKTEVRYIINPYYNGNKPEDGDIVRTPQKLQSTLTILPVYGEV